MNSCLNRTYRLVWSEVHNAWVAVAETVRSRTKSSGRSARARAVALVAGLFGSSLVWAQLPTGGQIVGGAGTISSSGTTMTVTQTTDRMAANWQSFNIGRGNTVNFVQPNSHSVALNRVLGSDVSVIQGALNANGKLFLINPNGVLFTKDSHVNVGSLVASTLNITTENFMAGNYRFEGASSNAIINQGNITAHGDGAGGGTVALIAAKIVNQGAITAHKGNVLMGAGSRVTLNLGGPVSIEIEQGALDALIEQGGAIRADGGLVYLTAKAANDIVTTVINHTGITEAQTLVTGESGQIYLMGDMTKGRVEVAGTLDASAPNGGDGGFIETSAAKVAFAADLNITTKALTGKTGQWLIDPVDFTVAASGGDITGAALGTLLASNSVKIQTATGTDSATEQFGASGTNGDIFVNDSVTWVTGNTLTLSAHRNIEINASITASHANGKLALEYGQWSTNGVSGGVTANYTINAAVTLQSSGNANGVNTDTQTNFSTKLGSTGSVQNFTTLTTVDGLQLLSTSSSARYALGAGIDLSGVNWVPASFDGRLDGLGNTIENLTVTGVSNLGLFSLSNANAIFSNLSLKNFAITSNQVQGSDANAGALVGQATGGRFYNIGLANINVSGGTDDSGELGEGSAVIGGLIGGTTSTNALTITRIRGEDIRVSGSYKVGGLVGIVYGDSRAHLFSGVHLNDVSIVISGLRGGGNGSEVGGMVGSFSSSSLGEIVGSSVTNLSITTKDNGYFANGMVGGLAGVLLGGKVLRSYTDGSIIVNNHKGVAGYTQAYGSIGGVVGRLFGAVISDSYSLVSVTVNGTLSSSLPGVGGLVGRAEQTSSISDSYAVGAVSSGDSVGSGLNYIGGFLGTYTGSGTLTLNRNYWDTASSGRLNGIGSTTFTLAGGSTAPSGKTTSEMRNPDTYVGWSSDVWSFPRAGRGATVAGYEYGGVAGLPFLTEVTRVDDRGGAEVPTILFDSGFGDVSGSGAYTIATWGQLQNINLVSAGGYDFILANDLGITTIGYAEQVKDGSALANGGTGWVPIGNSAAFNGSFDGQDHTISGLSIASSNNQRGLFGNVFKGWGQGNIVSIKNVKLVDVEISGGSDVGGLVGRGKNVHIENVSVSGEVNGFDNVGGLIGFMMDADNTVLNSQSTVAVSGINKVGGLVGYLMDSSIIGSYAAGGVTGTGNDVGGLVGNSVAFDNGNTIQDSYASGNVTVADNSGNIGGLVGSADKTSINQSYATGNVTVGYSSVNVGGLVGLLKAPSPGTDSEGEDYEYVLKETYATGTVTAGNFAQNVGGLIGELNSTGSSTNYVRYSFATGPVEAGESSSSIGGLVGKVTNGFLNRTYAAGLVSGGANSTYVGGLVGASSVENAAAYSFWDTQASGRSTSAGGTGKNTAEMNLITTFNSGASNSRWSFEIDPNRTADYPVLKMDGYGKWIIKSQPSGGGGSNGGGSGGGAGGSGDTGGGGDAGAMNDSRQNAVKSATNEVSKAATQNQMVSSSRQENGQVIVRTDSPSPLTQQTASIAQSGGLKLVQVDQEPDVTGNIGAAGRDPGGFMRVFAVRGGVNVPQVEVTQICAAGAECK